MRVIGDIPHPSYKITVFSWNGKYVLKIEKGMLEQTYKIQEYELKEQEIPSLLDQEFLKNVESRFKSMESDLNRAIASI